MEILLVATTNKLLGLASRLAQEGHTIKLWGSCDGNGFVEKLRHPYNAVKECRFIIMDYRNDMIWDWAKTFNKPVIGTHPLIDMLNNDCFKEYQIASKLGVELPETEVLEDLSDMYDKVMDWRSARTLIRYDRETISCDHQSWLAWATHKLPLNKRILLQRPTWGEEMQVFCWYDGFRWVKPFLLKTPSEDSLRTSSMLALFSRDWTERIAEQWDKFLKTTEYKGPVRLRFYAGKDRLQLKDVYMGFEFPSIYAYCEGLKGMLGDFLYHIAFATNTEIDYTTDFVSSASVTTTLKEPEDAPIIGLDEGNQKHTYFGCVRKSGEDIVVGKKPEWVYTITAHGRSLSESFGRLHFTSKSVQIPEQNIMNGIRPVHERWFEKIRTLGYL